MIYVEQVRAARALLGWNQAQLAEEAGIGGTTIKRLESKPGLLGGSADTAWRIQGALEKAGVIFIDDDETGGPGARLAKSIGSKDSG